jgi:hypothetical protein
MLLIMSGGKIMLLRKCTLLFLLAVAGLVVGCSGSDGPVAPAGPDAPASAVLRGEIPRDLVAFEFSAKMARGEDDPAPGSLLVRGSNLAYDDAAGELSMDLTLVNAGDGSYAEPVSLTFLQLLPAGLTVVDADNGETGPGAAFTFTFENDDAMWTPGEESLPRGVRFVVASGTSIGFLARIDAETSLLGGSIGGMVWQDENRDGMMDEGEAGVGGVSMALHGGDTSSDPLQTALTGDDGTYRFDGLDAGFYTVVRLPRADLMGTTPAEMAVVLVDTNGTVADFMLADFGVVTMDMPPSEPVAVGDYVQAKGAYEAEPHRLVAEILSVCRPDMPVTKHGDGDDDDEGEDYDDYDDCGDADRMDGCWGRLAGPVTAYSREDGILEIMGTPVHFQDKCDCDDVEDGLRMRVDATRDADVLEGEVLACGHLKPWRGHRDRVSGFVQEVVRGEDDAITGVVILNTLVTWPREMPDPQ